MDPRSSPKPNSMTIFATAQMALMSQEHQLVLKESFIVGMLGILLFFSSKVNDGICGYQSWLTNGLNVYLLSDKRGMDIISRNKKGIFSIFVFPQDQELAMAA
ncbi:hypothetical protein REPUB_Repub04eG0145800 [Reevesia pubescens]